MTIDVYVVTMQYGASSPHQRAVEPTKEAAFERAMQWGQGLVSTRLDDEDAWKRRQGNQHRPTRWRHGIGRRDGRDPINFYVRRFSVDSVSFPEASEVQEFATRTTDVTGA
jgi:hypothetical protein